MEDSERERRKVNEIRIKKREREIPLYILV